MPPPTPALPRRPPAGLQRGGRILAAALLCVLSGGCGVPLDDSPRDVTTPGVVLGPGVPVSAGAGHAVVRVYLVHEGRLIRVTRTAPTAGTPQLQLRDLLAGPAQAESDRGLTTALSTMTGAQVAVSDRRAVVSIAPAPPAGSRSDEVLAYGQIVCTLTSRGAEIGTVSFVSGGEPLAVPRADGSLADTPLTIADYASLIE